MKPASAGQLVLERAVLLLRGNKPESVNCPDNLKGIEGATLRCELATGGKNYGVNVTVTGVDGGTVNCHFEVEDQPL